MRFSKSICNKLIPEVREGNRNLVNSHMNLFVEESYRY